MATNKVPSHSWALKPLLRKSTGDITECFSSPFIQTVMAQWNGQLYYFMCIPASFPGFLEQPTDMMYRNHDQNKYLIWNEEWFKKANVVRYLNCFHALRHGCVYRYNHKRSHFLVKLHRFGELWKHMSRRTMKIHAIYCIYPNRQSNVTMHRHYKGVILSSLFINWSNSPLYFRATNQQQYTIILLYSFDPTITHSGNTPFKMWWNVVYLKVFFAYSDCFITDETQDVETSL